MKLLQGFLYFVWCPRDSWTIKGTSQLIRCHRVHPNGCGLQGCLSGTEDAYSVDLIVDYKPSRTNSLQLTALYSSTFIAQACRTWPSCTGVSLLYDTLARLAATSRFCSRVRYVDHLRAMLALKKQNRGGIQTTNRILNFIILTAINRGFFTMLFAALNMILRRSTLCLLSVK
ncbi:hypothetical protein K438DRAFT_237090 [Mycena galopus ATCC 62051]|nr:hypothetical protein K438DRAFT_237090 [Mycena galopus ATCC 62051]